MTKELEALEEIRNISIYSSCGEYQGESFEIYKDEIHSIETALKRNIELKKGIKTLEKKCNRYQKKLKALYIIKEKSISVGILQMCLNLDAYNNRIIEHPNVIKTKKLTQEEYDLLKEVLL